MSLSTDHDVVWLYVAVDHANHRLAVVQRLQEVEEEEAGLPGWEAFLRLARAPALVDPRDLVTQTTVGVVLGDEIDVAVRVVDDFVQPNEVRVLELLQDLHFFLDAVRRRDVGYTEAHALKLFAIHLFDGELLPRRHMLVESDSCKLARAEGLQRLVVAESLFGDRGLRVSGHGDLALALLRA